MNKSLFTLALLGATTVAAVAGAAQDTPRRVNALFDAKTQEFVLPGRAAEGENITLTIRNVNPLIYNTTVYETRIRALIAPTGAGAWPRAAAAKGGPEAPLPGDFSFSKNYAKAMVDLIVKADLSFRKGETDTLLPLAALAKEAVEMAGEVVQIEVNSPVDQSVFTKMVEAINAQVQGNAKEAALKEVEQAKAVYLAANRVKTTINQEITMPAGNHLEIQVASVPRGHFADEQGNEIADLPLTDPRLREIRSANQRITLEGSTEQRFTAAVFLVQNTDRTYGVKNTKQNAGDPDQFVIKRKGDTDELSAYIGTLYHFDVRRSKDWDVSLGVGTNGQKLAYFVGFSYRLGSNENAPGALSFGVVANQVDRLDRVNVNDPWDADKPIPTRSVFRWSFGIGLSLRV